jgi:hypothetical protein
MATRLGKVEDIRKSQKPLTAWEELSEEETTRMMRYQFSRDDGVEIADEGMALAEAMGWEIDRARKFLIRSHLESVRAERARVAKGEPDPLDGHPYQKLTSAELNAVGLALLDGVTDDNEFARRVGWSEDQFKGFIGDLESWKTGRSHEEI